jgi:molybdopterin-binding protein
MTNLFELNGVCVGYANVPVLQEFNLVVGKGSLVGLMGGNGSGKTTCLHLLDFLMEPEAGELLFDGVPVASGDGERLRRRVGFVMQHPYMLDATVLDNVALGLAIRGVPKAERQKTARKALEEVGLAQLGGRNATRLSGGEVKRVALARTLALDPEVLLMDEPTENLDSDSRAAIERLLPQLVEQRGKTVVIASHDRGSLIRLGAQSWRIEDGRAVAERWENVFRGSVEGGGKAHHFTTAGLTLATVDLPPEAHWVSISPTEVIISKTAMASSARNQLRAKIVAAHPSKDGEIMRVTLDCGEELIASVTCDSWAELGLERGAEVYATFKASAVKAL